MAGPTSALTHYERGLLRTWLAERPTRTVATWHPDHRGENTYVRVTFTTWGRRDVVSQDGTTVATLKDAWHLVCNMLGVPDHIAADTRAFRGWAALGKR